MELSNLMVDVKTAWIDYPGLKGVRFKLAHLSRPELSALRKRCVETIFDRKTRQPVEKLNDDKFMEEFSDAIIKDWSGLTLEHLESLLLIDITGQDPQTVLPYSKTNARSLITNSTDFDTWINEVVFDLSNFRTRTERAPVESSGQVAE